MYPLLHHISIGIGSSRSTYKMGKNNSTKNLINIKLKTINQTNNYWRQYQGSMCCMRGFISECGTFRGKKKPFITTI